MDQMCESMDKNRIQAPWGEPARPGLPTEGETVQGRSNFHAASGLFVRARRLSQGFPALLRKSLHPHKSRNSALVWLPLGLSSLCEEANSWGLWKVAV